MQAERPELGSGFIELAFARGPFWDEVREATQMALKRGRVFGIAMSQKNAEDLIAEAEVYGFEGCYLSVCGILVYVDDLPDEKIVFQRTDPSA